jgi:hypothetical protein
MTRRSYGHLSLAVLLGLAFGQSFRQGWPWWISWTLVVLSVINIIIARTGEL